MWEVDRVNSVAEYVTEVAAFYNPKVGKEGKLYGLEPEGFYWWIPKGGSAWRCSGRRWVVFHKPTQKFL
jgi:hypothetical protein